MIRLIKHLHAFQPVKYPLLSECKWFLPLYYMNIKISIKQYYATNYAKWCLWYTDHSCNSRVKWDIKTRQKLESTHLRPKPNKITLFWTSKDANEKSDTFLSVNISPIEEAIQSLYTECCQVPTSWPAMDSHLTAFCIYYVIRLYQLYMRKLSHLTFQHQKFVQCNVTWASLRYPNCRI